jgi:hypothetical protein
MFVAHNVACNMYVTPYSRVIFEKLTFTQLVKKFPAFYGTRRFITVYTTSRHWSLSWTTWIQSTSHHIFLWYILILSSHVWDVSKRFRTESITKGTTTINTHWEAIQSVMAEKLTRLAHKIAIQLRLAAESSTICSSRSRRPVRKLFDTPSYVDIALNLNVIGTIIINTSEH